MGTQLLELGIGEGKDTAVAPVESLWLPTSGKHGISGKAREALFGLFDDTGIESLATQYDLYLNEQANRQEEEVKKQEDIRVQKEQEFTKLIDTELENRLKFLYAETTKPDYIKAQETAERNEDTMGLSPEMFKGISGEGQKGLSIGSATEKAVEKTEKVNEANEQLAETIKEETESKRQSIEQTKISGDIQDVRKRGKADDSYDKWIVDRVVKNELGEVTDTIYKKQENHLELAGLLVYLKSLIKLYPLSKTSTKILMKSIKRSQILLRILI